MTRKQFIKFFTNPEMKCLEVPTSIGTIAYNFEDIDVDCGDLYARYVNDDYDDYWEVYMDDLERHNFKTKEDIINMLSECSKDMDNEFMLIKFFDNEHNDKNVSDTISDFIEHIGSFELNDTIYTTKFDGDSTIILEPIDENMSSIDVTLDRFTLFYNARMGNENDIISEIENTVEIVLIQQKQKAIETAIQNGYQYQEVRKIVDGKIVKVYPNPMVAAIENTESYSPYNVKLTYSGIMKCLHGKVKSYKGNSYKGEKFACFY